MTGIRMERDCIREKRGRGKETEAGIDYLAGDKHTRVGGLRGIFCHSNNDNSVMCRTYESISAPVPNNGSKICVFCGSLIRSLCSNFTLLFDVKGEVVVDALDKTTSFTHMVLFALHYTRKFTGALFQEIFIVVDSFQSHIIVSSPKRSNCIIETSCGTC